jgi:hypothetical protein
VQVAASSQAWLGRSLMLACGIWLPPNREVPHVWLTAQTGRDPAALGGPLLTDAVDKAGGMTGLVLARCCEAEMRWFSPSTAPGPGFGLDADATGRDWHWLSTQLTRPRELAAARRDAAPSF